MQTITTIGLDIAKSVFQVHGVDAEGNVVVRRQLKRRYVLTFFQRLPPCLVGIEACASSHHWSRELQSLGHTVRLMPPAYVKPYVKKCSPTHFLTNHQVLKMRRNVLGSAVCQRYRPTFLRIISERVEPGEQAGITFPG
jgi:hypothetical protein